MIDILRANFAFSMCSIVNRRRKNACTMQKKVEISQRMLPCLNQPTQSFSLMQNIHHNHDLLLLLTFSSSSSILNGLAITSFIPASVIWLCCSSLTLAVTPMILTAGKLLSPSNFLISREAVVPSMMGISWSMRTQSKGGLCSEERAVIISKASLPLSAVVT